MRELQSLAIAVELLLPFLSLLLSLPRGIERVVLQTPAPQQFVEPEQVQEGPAVHPRFRPFLKSLLRIPCIEKPRDRVVRREIAGHESSVP